MDNCYEVVRFYWFERERPIEKHRSVYVFLFSFVPIMCDINLAFIMRGLVIIL